MNANPSGLLWAALLLFTSGVQAQLTDSTAKTNVKKYQATIDRYENGIAEFEEGGQNASKFASKRLFVKLQKDKAVLEGSVGKKRADDIVNEVNGMCQDATTMKLKGIEPVTV